MMPTDTKLNWTSVLRPADGTTEDRRESRGSPPMGYAHRSQKGAPIVFSQNLHAKGFGGGVPLNTETAAVKPRAGIK